MGNVIWTGLKILVLALVVLYGIWFGAENLYVMETVIEFQAPVPFQDGIALPGVSVWGVFAGLFLVGLLLGSFKGIGFGFKQRSKLRKASRTISELEGEVVSYRGNAAREAETSRYDDPDV